MNESKSSKAAGLMILIGALALGVVVFILVRQPPEQSTETADRRTVTAKDAGPPPDAGAPAQDEPAAEPAAVKPGEEQIREWVAALSPDEEFGRWAASRYLLGKFVAVVENISSGQSPRKVLGFMEPKGDFKVVQKGDKEYLDPDGYARYDHLAQAFASLDAGKCARLYEKLYPWMDKKYRELGEPGLDFKQATTKAIAELLEVPIVEGEILLKRIEVTLEMANPALEGMSAAQKHLFRMGPDNIRKVQARLREIGRALGISAELDEMQSGE